MINLIQFPIIPVFGMSELCWIVRKKELIQVPADTASLLQIIALELTHHNKVTRRFGQAWRLALLRCSQI